MNHAVLTCGVAYESAIPEVKVTNDMAWYTIRAQM
jgi:hypothetical protein